MGRDIIETGFAEFLTESNKLLRPLFEARMFDMKRKPKKKKKNLPFLVRSDEKLCH